MQVLGFWTRERTGDTVIVNWKDKVVAVDYRSLALAVGCGDPDLRPEMIEHGDMLPSVFPPGWAPRIVTLPDKVLASFKPLPPYVGEPGRWWPGMGVVRTRGRRR